MDQKDTSVKGMPSEIFGISTENRPQNTSWVYTGVPRKNQMKNQLTPRSTGLMDLRITASITDRTIATIMEITVSSSVYPTPSSTLSLNRYFQTVGQSSRSLVTIPCTSIAASSATMTAATTGPVRLTGSALIRFGMSSPRPSTSFFAIIGSSCLSIGRPSSGTTPTGRPA